MGKIKLVYIILLVSFPFLIKAQSNDLYEMAYSMAKSYINKSAFIDTSQVVNVEIQDSKKDYYLITIYVSGLPWESHPPYKIKYFKKNLICLFDEVNNLTDQNVVEDLRSQNLLVEINDGVVKYPKSRFHSVYFNEIESWFVFLCKSDFGKVKITKSLYELDDNQIPYNICDE